ncbi:MAG: ROK family protein, partial [Dehalococcoidia bacterium]
LALLTKRLRALIKGQNQVFYEGVGVSVPGRVDDATGRLVFAPNLGWRDVDLKTPLERATGLPVELENAANACALAEAWFGEHREGVRDLVAVTVSEGIGTGIIANGQLLRGPTGLAGEFGHISINEDGPACSCGNRGCWERYASNSVAVASYVQASDGHRNGRRASRQGPDPTFEDILRRAEQGDAKAGEALDRMARYLGLGFAMLATAFAPRLIVVVGEVTHAWDRVSPIITRVLAERCAIAAPRIVPAGDGGQGRLRGTIALVLQKHFGAPMVA